MADPDKVHKLIHRLQCLTSRLERMPDLVTHQHINQFYYMQKAIELKLLCDQLEEVRNRVACLSERLQSNYEATFNQWRIDLKWLKEND